MPESIYELRNETDELLVVWLEPWGSNWDLVPGEQLRVTANSPEAGTWQAERKANSITLYAWPGCTLQVFRNGVLVYTSDFPVPGLPPGINMQTFVGVIFRGEESPGTQAPKE